MPAWAAGLYIASALIAVLELAPAARGCGAACALMVADAVSPPAKLMVGALLGALMLAARRRQPAGFAAMALRDAIAGMVAVALALALIPAGWSRGFGLGLFEQRFAPLPTLIYLASAAAGAVVGTLLERSCRRRLDGR